MSGHAAPWAARRPPSERSKPCLFTLLATGLVLGGGSEASTIEWAKFIRTRHVSYRQKMSPKPHQRQAVRDVLKGLKAADRGKVVMACGTGKTFTSLLAAWPASPRRSAQGAAAASGSDGHADPAERALAGPASCPASCPVAAGSASPPSSTTSPGFASASKAMRFWSERSGAAPDFIQPGKPARNALVEGLNGKFRDSCLNRHWFMGLADARRVVDDWRHHCNH